MCECLFQTRMKKVDLRELPEVEVQQDAEAREIFATSAYDTTSGWQGEGRR